MTWAEIKTRLRRWLRDPDGEVWTDAQLLRYWNNAQDEVAQKTGCLERVECWPYPSRFTYTYLHEWERLYAEGDRLRVLLPWLAQGWTVTYPWEPAYWDSSASPADDGYRTTQSWEDAYGTAADSPVVQFGRLMLRSRFVAYDEEEIQPITRRKLASEDEYYRSRSGEPEGYYPVDDEEQHFALYPRPSVTWQDPDITDFFDDTGGIEIWTEGTLSESPYGITTETLDPSGALFAVYEAVPVPLEDAADETDFPAYLVHYVEAATLARAFGADADGFIPTLRDYWRARADLGIATIKRFRLAKLSDRVIQKNGRRDRQRGHVRLPDHYPALRL